MAHRSGVRPTAAGRSDLDKLDHPGTRHRHPGPYQRPAQSARPRVVEPVEATQTGTSPRIRRPGPRNGRAARLNGPTDGGPTDGDRDSVISTSSITRGSVISTGSITRGERDLDRLDHPGGA